MEYDLRFLENIYKKLSDYETKTHREGTDISILQIAGKEQSEVVICRLISFLLNPNEKHGQKEKFLNLFLQTIKEIEEKSVLSEDELKSLQVITEFPANRRRIDIVIKSNKRFLPFEVKIWATDQNTQCKDYYDFAKDQHPVGAKKIFYLTIDGHVPNASSMDKLKDEGHLELLSFRNHILSWLEQCENDKDSYSPILQEYIRELKLAVRKFCGYTENQRMYEEILKEIIRDDNNLKAAKAICSIEKEIRPDSLWEKFWKTISESDIEDDRLPNYELAFGINTGDVINTVDVIYEKLFDCIEITYTGTETPSDIQLIYEKLRSILMEHDYNCTKIENNGFSINNCREKFLGKDISSNFDLYVLFKHNKEAIIENIKKFNDLIFQSLK